MKTMNKGLESSHKLSEWGNSMLNKCNSRLRNSRKRPASKARRVLERKEISDGV